MSALSGLEGIPAHAPGQYTTKAGIEAVAGMIPD
jgi:hypothetical protein